MHVMCGGEEEGLCWRGSHCCRLARCSKGKGGGLPSTKVKQRVQAKWAVPRSDQQMCLISSKQERRSRDRSVSGRAEGIRGPDEDIYVGVQVPVLPCLSG